MKNSKLSIILGLKVTDALLSESDAGISFEGEISLVIYNRYELEGFSSNDAQWLVGKMVTHVDEATDTTTIRFENDLVLRIDMRDEAYTGPEAMQLLVPGEPTVVWS